MVSIKFCFGWFWMFLATMVPLGYSYVFSHGPQWLKPGQLPGDMPSALAVSSIGLVIFCAGAALTCWFGEKK